MAAHSELAVFRELSDLYERQGQPQLRDRFLLLAADAALEDGDPIQADLLRLRLLHFSPHHMLKPFASFAEALASPDLRAYLNDLKESYPIEVAQQMLDTLRQAAPRGDPSSAASHSKSGGKEAEDLGTLKFPPDRRRPSAETRQPAAEAVPVQLPPKSSQTPPVQRPSPIPQIPRLVPSQQKSTRPPRIGSTTPDRVIPMPPREGPAKRGPTRPELPHSTTNSGAALFLFVLTLLLGLALAGYTLIKPFLQ
jgi:hypothetical protein